MNPNGSSVSENSESEPGGYLCSGSGDCAAVSSETDTQVDCVRNVGTGSHPAAVPVHAGKCREPGTFPGFSACSVDFRKSTGDTHANAQTLCRSASPGGSSPGTNREPGASPGACPGRNPGGIPDTDPKGNRAVCRGVAAGRSGNAGISDFQHPSASPPGGCFHPNGGKRPMQRVRGYPIRAGSAPSGDLPSRFGQPGGHPLCAGP